MGGEKNEGEGKKKKEHLNMATTTMAALDFPQVSGTRPGHWTPDCLGKYQMRGSMCDVAHLPLFVDP